MRIVHAAWPTGIPVYNNMSQRQWNEYAEGHRPPGYTGGMFDYQAYAEFHYLRSVDIHRELWATNFPSLTPSPEQEKMFIEWRLWVDDDLNNFDASERWIPEGWLGAKTSDEAIALVLKYGFENLVCMDLDHDLGMDANNEPQDIKKFLKWLTETYPEGRVTTSPAVPEFKVHSRNVDGAPWILSYLDSWKRSLG